MGLTRVSAPGRLRPVSMLLPNRSVSTDPDFQ